jgi:hypothetical protein
MSDKDQDLFADYVRSRDIKSFIPLGHTGAGGTEGGGPSGRAERERERAGVAS